MIRVVAVALFALIFGYAAGRASADQGSAIFAAKCSACHTIGKGNLSGPDLKGIAKIRSRAWLEKWIMSPSAVIASGDPTAVQLLKHYSMQMPDLGLSQADADAVLGYIAQQSGSASGGAKAAAEAPAVALPPGDSEVGRALFVGSKQFQNGGASCMSCHSISGIGAFGGGTLGPNLTNVFKTLGGEAGLTSFLHTTPTPIMHAVWAQHPLTSQEIADLVAFIKEGPFAPRSFDVLARLIVPALLGAIILMLIAAITWRRRLRGVRIPLVARANAAFFNKRQRRL